MTATAAWQNDGSFTLQCPSTDLPDLTCESRAEGFPSTCRVSTRLRFSWSGPDSTMLPATRVARWQVRDGELPAHQDRAS